MTNIYMRTKTHVMLVGTMYYANMLCITDIPNDIKIAKCK